MSVVSYCPYYTEVVVEAQRHNCVPCSHGDEVRVHGLIQAMLLLAVGEQPRHGYELAKVLAAELPEGMVPDMAVSYRILRKFETEGFVTSRLVPGEGGPARKVYALTASGADYLAQWQETVRVRVTALQLFLQKYEQLGNKLSTEEDTQ
jgi:PadR family transcriptional regulator, regulatory protein PadR